MLHIMATDSDFFLPLYYEAIYSEDISSRVEDFK